jgi:hypothetical protein
MRKLVKQIGIGLVALTLSFTAVAQSTTPIQKFIPLLSGYNVLVPTNRSVGMFATNVLYTTYGGQVLYSLTNNIGGGVGSNSIAGDAFDWATLSADANGDINANAALIITWGNTNYIPMVTTNLSGQWIIPPAGFTNAYFGTTGYGGWPLATSAFPNWMTAATTNYYPLFSACLTNAVTVSLYRAVSLNYQGTPNSSVLGPSIPLVETTSQFSFVLTNISMLSPGGFITNLPATWLQGGKFAYATIAITNAASTGTTGPAFPMLVNQLGILQPQP